jgi:elongation factor P
MASYNTNEFRSGLRIIIDRDPCVIVENEFVKPGKGQAFNRVRIRNLKTGKTVDKTFKSGESVEAADVMETDMQFLYSDGEHWHFMVADTYEQFAADERAVAEARKWLTDQDVCQVTLWNNTPLVVEAPKFVELEITDTEPDRARCKGGYRKWWRETRDPCDRRGRSRAVVRGARRSYQSRHAIRRIRLTR